MGRKHIRRRRRKTIQFDPQWTVEIVRKLELNETTLRRNGSLRCFYDLVKGCSTDNGEHYFEAYPQKSHCNTAQIPDK